MSQARNIKAHLAIFTANLIYAGNYSIAKIVMPQYVAPYGLIVVRVVLASAFFWLVDSFFKTEKIQSRQDYIRLAVCAIFGIALNQLTFFKGLSLTNPINPAIMMTTTPILVLLISLFYLKEKVTTSKIIGIILGMGGAIGLLLFRDSFSMGKDTIVGDLLVMVNASSYGLYLVLAKPLFYKYKPLTIIKWVFTFGILFVVPVGGAELIETDWTLLTDEAWWSLGYVVILTTFFAYLFNSFGLKAVSPTVVSFYIYLQPILASIIAIMLGKDQLTITKICLALLIFVGVYLVSKPTKKIKL
jgi:drug/metabolite transporter (DMT)-like permease